MDLHWSTFAFYVQYHRKRKESSRCVTRGLCWLDSILHFKHYWHWTGMDGRQTSSGIMLLLLLLCWWWWRSWWTWESVTTNPVPLNEKVDNTATNTKNHDPANMATNKTVSHSTCWNWTLHIIWICNFVVAMVEQMLTKVDPVSVDLPPQVTSSSSSSSCHIDNYGYNCHRLVQSMDGVASLLFRSLSLSMIIVLANQVIVVFVQVLQPINWDSVFCSHLLQTTR